MRSGCLRILRVCPIEESMIELVVYDVVRAVKRQTQNRSEVNQVFRLFDFGHKVKGDQKQTDDGKCGE